MEYETCGTKEEQEDVEDIICEPKVEEDEREEEEHKDDKIYEPKINNLKIAAMEEEYSAFIRDQASGAITCIVDDMKEASKDDYVNEVNSYESWDVVSDMSLKDIDNGLHEDLVRDVWYAKEDWYGIVRFITGVINSTRLDDDEIYTWIEFIAKEYFQQQTVVPARCWKRRKKEIYRHQILVPTMCWRKRKKIMSTMATSFCDSILTKFFLPWESDAGASCIRKIKNKKKCGSL